MISYSWRKILLKCGRSPKRIILAFSAHITENLPKNKFDPLYQYHQIDFDGSSFMLNPHELIRYAFKWKPRHVAEYIGLASFRNYSNYVVTKDKTLDLLHSPVSEETINNNPLLRIKNRKIHFLYEEQITTRKKLWH